MNGTRRGTSFMAALVALAISLPGLSASASSPIVTLNGWDPSILSTFADDSVVGSASHAEYPAALPYSYTSTSIDGEASAASVYGFSNAGFEISFEHSRAGALKSSGSSQGDIYFSVDRDVEFVATGSYAASDPDGRQVLLIAFLYDFNTGTYPFYSKQSSYSTPNESFTLGEAGGDYSNTDDGSLTGTLIAGHDYNFYFVAKVQALTASTSGATSSGSLSLSFVPEPGTALLQGTALLVLIGLATRRRNS